MDSANSKPEMFRGNWICIVLLVLFGVALFATALGMLVLTFTVAFPLDHYTFSRALNVFGWAFGTLAAGLCSAGMFMQGSQMAHYVALVDELGVDFRFGSKRNKRDIVFVWDQIAEVRHKTSPAGKSYAVVGKDKRIVEFTAFTFFRPKKLALKIAEHINQPIQEAKF
jgi:hypothetical protein